MLNRSTITLLCIILIYVSKAQLQVKNHFSLTGKKDISVKVMAEDFSGQLLFGTNEGVFINDGKNTKMVGENIPQIKTEITALYFDETGILWIGVKGGKVYTYFKSKLDSIPFKENENTSDVTNIVHTNSGVLIGTYGNGVFTYKNNQLKHFSQDNGLSDNVIYTIVVDEQNNIWCGTDAGINMIADAFGKAKFALFANKEGLPDNIVRHLHLYKNKMIVSMQDSGVCIFDINQNRIERFPFLKNWTRGTVLHAEYTGKDKLMIATEKNGLFKIINGLFYTYNYDELIQSNSVNYVLVDNSKQIWLATKKGISQLSNKRFNIINKTKGLAEDKILALAIDDHNNVWIGTSMGISRIENIEGGGLVETKIQKLNKLTISCATKAPDGNIWFGTYGNGIVIMSSESQNNVMLNAKDDQLPDDNISAIFFANDTTVYISTLGSGLIKAHVELKGKTKLFKLDKTYTQDKDGLGNDYVYNVITDKNGKLYVATDGGGLNVLENEKFTDISKKYKVNSNTFFALCCDQNNHIWASSNNDGIVKFDGKSIKYFNLENGIRDLQPQQMIVLGKSLYAINAKGIDIINIENGEVTYGEILDKDLEPNLNAICLFGNKIISGTNNGLLVYRTDKNKTDSIKPKVIITSLFINYKPCPLDSTFEFKYKQNNISLGFKGIWLKNPDKLTYRYRLNGLETEWEYSETEKVVNYNNLNPGIYDFIVQVKNEEDVWSDPEGYSFIILTPIWKRWWFWTLIFLIVVIGGYWFVQLRLKALQRENLILEEKVTHRTKEIEKQKKIIEEKNKDITDSISYARKIQHAILPNSVLVKKHLPESFVLYVTKDIVSGDFYFFTHFEDTSIIAAIDCTGHGVPGAFMSLIGYNILNQIINENKITNPAEILLQLNKGVIGVIHKNESESKDGMDVAICKINHQDSSLEYAGAMRPLWIINNNELTEIKADKIPIGTKQEYREDEIKYRTHKIPYDKENYFYIFTDGFGDQFGGEKEKKFGTAKFKELLLSNHKLDFETQLENAKTSHLSWKGNLEQVDDILLIGFRV